MTIKINNLILCTICVFITQILSPVWCNTADKEKIDSALAVLKQYGYEKNLAVLQGDNYTHKPVKIIFKDLSELDFAYSKFYAISVNDDNTGDLYILINNDLKNSDARCLASLIVHELTHCKFNKPDTVSEEMQAHTLEVMLYNRILEDDESVQNKTDDRLVRRLNSLKKIYDDAIRAYISNNSSYVNYLKIKD